MLPSQVTLVHQTGQFNKFPHQKYSYKLFDIKGKKPTEKKNVCLISQVLLILPNLWVVGFAMSFPQVKLF